VVFLSLTMFNRDATAPAFAQINGGKGAARGAIWPGSFQIGRGWCLGKDFCRAKCSAVVFRAVTEERRFGTLSMGRRRCWTRRNKR